MNVVVLCPDPDRTPPAALRSASTASPSTEVRPRIGGPSRRARHPRNSYSDPLFRRPDLIEDDYYRLRNQPHG
jgi:hypothetical protein